MEDILNNTPQQPNAGVNNPTDNVEAVLKEDYVIKEPPPHGLDSSWRRWKCLVCGYVYEGLQKGPMVCPKCGNNNQDKFDEAE